MTEKQQILLKSAQEIFCDLGYAAASTAKIGRLAGTSEALIFRHFGSKKALASAVVKHGNTCRAGLAYAALNDPNPEHIIRDYLGLYDQYLSKPTTFVPWLASIRIANEDPSFFVEDGFIVERLSWAVGEIGHANAGAVSRVLISTLDRALLLAHSDQKAHGELLISGLREVLINE